MPRFTLRVVAAAGARGNSPRRRQGCGGTQTRLRRASRSARFIPFAPPMLGTGQREIQKPKALKTKSKPPSRGLSEASRLAGGATLVTGLSQMGALSVNRCHAFRSGLKIRILVSDQGEREFQTGGIHRYFEDLERAFNADMEPKDFFEIASSDGLPPAPPVICTIPAEPWHPHPVPSPARSIPGP